MLLYLLGAHLWAEGMGDASDSPPSSEYLLDFGKSDDDDDDWRKSVVRQERSTQTSESERESENDSTANESTGIGSHKQQQGKVHPKSGRVKQDPSERYQGVMRASDVESLLGKTDFLIYHALPEHVPMSLDAVPLALPLRVAYRTSLGEFRHYPVVAQTQRKKGITQTLYSVQSGSKNVPLFNSVATLLSYYEKYACVQHRPYKNQPTIDVFPWWLDHN